MTKRSARGAAKRRAAKRKEPRPALEAHNADTQQLRGVCLSMNQAAEEFGRDRQTIRKRISELAVRPAGERDGFPVYRLRDLLEMERKSESGEIDPDKLPAFQRHAHYKAEFEKLRVNAERGEYMRREEAEQHWAEVLMIIAQELGTIVDEIERDIGAPALVLQKIEDKIDSIRERMYANVINMDNANDMSEVGTEDGAGAAAATQ